MKKICKTSLSAISLAVLGLMVGCATGGGPVSGSSADKAVTIQFAAVNGSAPVKCGTPLTNVGRSAVTAEVKDLRFYITNLALVNDKGESVPVKLDSNLWQFTQGHDAVALIDFEDATAACATAYNTAETNTVITGKVPAGNYVGLRASMGVPQALTHNATSGSPPPLDIAAMAWSWQAGRRFAKIEINPVGGVARLMVPKGSTETVSQQISTFNLHLGSSGCTAKVDASGIAVKDATGNPSYTCSNPNVVNFTLPRFDVATQAVALDVGQLFKTNDLSKDDGGAVGCMAGPTDPECVAIFEALQVTFGSGSTGMPINGGATQTVFKAVTL